MEALLPFLLLLSATAIVLVAADGSTNHYLHCLHESQCKKVFDGDYCCPKGTCCHFFVWQSSKVMSICKRIRPDQTLYCQDRDKVLLNGQDLLDKRFYDDPPNRGKVCFRRRSDKPVFCFGGTNSEEDEFKAKGTDMTYDDQVDIVVKGETLTYESIAEDVDKSKIQLYALQKTRPKKNFFVGNK